MDVVTSEFGHLALDADGRLDMDIHCAACEYNLRSLLPDGRCPECGIAIGQSTHGDMLRFCEPTWVETLTSGMNWIVLSILLALVLGCGGNLVLFYVNKPAAAPPLYLIGGVVALIGYWKLTTLDPRKSTTEEGVTARQVVRLGQVLSLTLSLATIALQQIDMRLVEWVMMPAIVLGAIVTIALCMYAGALAERIPDQRLARHTRIVMWGWIVLGVAEVILALLGLAIGTSTTPTPGPGLWFGLVVVRGVSGIAALVSGIWSIMLIVKYRRRFRDAARLARETWARGAAGETYPAWPT